MKRLMTAILMLALFTTVVSAQDKPSQVDEIFKTVEDMPEYPGGQSELMAYMGSVEFPKDAKEGAVFVSFVIEPDGSVSNVTAAKSSGIDVLDETAIAHVRKMPNWKPGYQDGKAVRVQYVVPFKFKY